MWAPREQLFRFTFIPIIIPEAEPKGQGCWIQRGAKYVDPPSGSHSVGTLPLCGLLGAAMGPGSPAQNSPSQ